LPSVTLNWHSAKNGCPVVKGRSKGENPFKKKEEGKERREGLSAGEERQGVQAKEGMRCFVDCH